jgi:hypothetical protein
MARWHRADGLVSAGAIQHDIEVFTAVVEGEHRSHGCGVSHGLVHAFRQARKGHADSPAARNAESGAQHQGARRSARRPVFRRNARPRSPLSVRSSLADGGEPARISVPSPPPPLRNAASARSPAAAESTRGCRCPSRTSTASANVAANRGGERGDRLTRSRPARRRNEASCPGSTARTSAMNVLGAATSKQRRNSCRDERSSRAWAPALRSTSLKPTANPNPSAASFRK